MAPTVGAPSFPGSTAVLHPHRTLRRSAPCSAPTAPTAPRRSRRTPYALAVLLLAGFAAGGQSVAGPGPLAGTGVSLSSSSTQAREDGTATPGATVFRIASFNVLGAGHTDGPGGRKGWADGTTRQGWANTLIEERSLDVVGFQELQDVQLARFERDLGAGFGIFPGDTMSPAAMHNSIAWRESAWTLLEARTVKVPYFDGNMIAKPYVHLLHTGTGQTAWFYNTHHPANARGDAQRWRDQATRIELDLFADLATEFPGTPVFATGDLNDRQTVFCRYVLGSDLRASNGGYVADDGTCSPPADMKVDWVFGSSTATFTSSAALRTPLVQRITDHPVIVATASLPPAWAQTLDAARALVVDVPGLRPGALRRLGEARAPHLTALVAGATSTLDARPVVAHGGRASNLVSLLTGRPVDTAAGGHGVVAGTTVPDGSTVHASAGRYTSSVLDLVHNLDGSTAVVGSSPALGLLERTWGGGGGPDRFGQDDGADKIDVFSVRADDEAATRRMVGLLRRAPKDLALLHLDEVLTTGRARGFGSRPYLRAVEALDARLGRVLAAVDAGLGAEGPALVVLTSTDAGPRARQRDGATIEHPGLPLVVSVRSAAAPEDLYALNPSYVAPRSVVDPADARPVRLSDVGNMVLAALGLPALPGSRGNVDQALTFVRPPG